MKTMTTTPAEMDRIIWNFDTDWPQVEDPFTNQPDTAEADLALYLAAGPWADTDPLPDDLSPHVTRVLAQAVLDDARRELAAGMAARMAFDIGRLDTAYVQELCALPMRELINRFHDSEVSLKSLCEESREWITDQTAQLLYWEGQYERVHARDRQDQPPSLCELRQLSAGCSLMAMLVLEYFWGGEDDPFDLFFDKVVDAFPDSDFRQRGVTRIWGRRTDVAPSPEPPSDGVISQAV